MLRERRAPVTFSFHHCPSQTLLRSSTSSITIKSSQIVPLIQNYPRFYPTNQYKSEEKGAPVIHFPASLNSHKVPSSDPTFCHPQTQATLQLWVVLFGAKDFETKVNVYLYFLFTNNAVVVEYLLSLVGSFSKGRKLMTDDDWKV